MWFVTNQDGQKKKNAWISNWFSTFAAAGCLGWLPSCWYGDDIFFSRANQTNPWINEAPPPSLFSQTKSSWLHFSNSLYALAPPLFSFLKVPKFEMQLERWRCRLSITWWTGWNGTVLFFPPFLIKWVQWSQAKKGNNVLGTVNGNKGTCQRHQKNQ